MVYSAVSFGWLLVSHISDWRIHSNLYWGLDPQYEFLSLSNDIYFAWLGFISGTTVCTGTGSLIGLVFLGEGGDRIHTELSVLSSFIGFGCGAGVLRMTYMTVLATL